jgi:hypothetical protein
MNRNRTLWILAVALVLLAALAYVTMCPRHFSSVQTPPSVSQVIGLSETELRTRFPQLTELDNSFDLLVSKNLHPYHPPPGHKLLRFGSDYVVVELKDGKVIALHRVGG